MYNHPRLQPAPFGAMIHADATLLYDAPDLFYILTTSHTKYLLLPLFPHAHGRDVQSSGMYDRCLFRLALCLALTMLTTISLAGILMFIRCPRLMK